MRRALLPGEDGVRARDGKRLEIDLWGVRGGRSGAGDARDDRRGVERHRRLDVDAVSASPADLWGPLGYQFSDRMTGCLYTWTNANDPDDLFYWHSSQIPVSPGALRRQPPGVLLSLRLSG